MIKKVEFIKKHSPFLNELIKEIDKANANRWKAYDKTDEKFKEFLKKRYKIDGQLAIVDGGVVFAFDIGRRDQHKRGSFLVEFSELRG